LDNIDIDVPRKPDSSFEPITLYKESVEILMSIPGIGMITAMELLLELQDISRFQRAYQLAAYRLDIVSVYKC
jgi:ERCC4-type nuclease